MAYSPPLGTAAHFAAAGYDSSATIAGRFPAGTYAAPAGNSVHFVLAAYVYPVGSAINYVVPAIVGIEGIGAVTLEITASGVGEYVLSVIDGDGAVSVDVSATGAGAHGVAGAGAGAIGISAAGTAVHGVAGSGVASIAIGVDGTGEILRYELTGEVRFQGVLVNRLVRAYRRDTGELVGEMPTVAGRFKLHTGFAAREHYIVPIDPDELAEDYTPPIANRVLSVLAQDAV